MRLINAQGLESTGVREIARALKISPGNLSYYFGRKENIVEHHLNKLKHELAVLIEIYQQEEEDLYRFLELLKNCLSRQFEYRGLFHQDSRVSPDLLSELVEKNIVQLGQLGQLQLSEEDHRFLTGVINFHLQFWLNGIPLERAAEDQDALLRKYLLIFTKLLLLFASPGGRINLLKFKAGLMR